MQILTPPLVHEVLRRFFPAQNDNYVCDYVEELKELNDFGITTEDQFAELLAKRAREVMEIDRSPAEELYLQSCIEEEGEETVAARLKAGFWFSFPALLRITLELEFGDAYREYASKRDAVN